MWLYMVVGPCWCVYVALFGSSVSVSVSNVNFNVNFKIVFKTVYLCISW
jgi:hypothetical protein